jgi:hypothetical protein
VPAEPETQPDPIKLDVNVLRAKIREQKLKFASDTDWIFWSGFQDQEWIEAFIKNNPYTKMGDKTKYLGDVLSNDMVKEFRQPMIDAGKDWKFWSYFSKAYAQEVGGDVYLIIPQSRPLNKPYADGKGSNFWSFELPDLTRNGDVNKITRIYKGNDGNLAGQPYTIWNKPWGGHYGDPGNPDVPATQQTGPDINSYGDIPK